MPKIHRIHRRWNNLNFSLLVSTPRSNPNPKQPSPNTKYEWPEGKIPRRTHSKYHKRFLIIQDHQVQNHPPSQPPPPTVYWKFPPPSFNIPSTYISSITCRRAGVDFPNKYVQIVKRRCFAHILWRFVKSTSTHSLFLIPFVPLPLLARLTHFSSPWSRMHMFHVKLRLSPCICLDLFITVLRPFVVANCTVSRRAATAPERSTAKNATTHEWNSNLTPTTPNATDTCDVCRESCSTKTVRRFGGIASFRVRPSSSPC